MNAAGTENASRVTSSPPVDGANARALRRTRNARWHLHTSAQDWRHAGLLKCAGRARRRRRFAWPPGVGEIAELTRVRRAESKAAWRFASRRTPKCTRVNERLACQYHISSACDAWD